MSSLSPDFLVDFTEARYAPVINVVVERPDGRILLVKRSRAVGYYPGYWNGIGGFLDDRRDLADKAAAELSEELGLTPADISQLETGEIFHADEPEYGKTWIIHPVLVRVRKSEISLDWEASDHVWIRPEEVEQYKVVPSFLQVLKKFQLWPC